MKQLKIALVMLAIGGLMTTAVFVMAFTSAEVMRFGTVTLPERADTVFPLVEVTADGYRYERPWLSQKIFFFHVPVGTASFLVFAVAAFFSVRFLMTKRKEHDTKARIAMETTVMFVILTMITGVLWTRASWGYWWTWDPRLSTYFIMTLMIIGYFVLRNSIEDDERRAVYAAVFACIAFLNAPISYFITDIVETTHPQMAQSELTSSILIPLMLGQSGMLIVGYVIYTARMLEERLQERVEILKDRFEGR